MFGMIRNVIRVFGIWMLIFSLFIGNLIRIIYFFTKCHVIHKHNNYLKRQFIITIFQFCFYRLKGWRNGWNYLFVIKLKKKKKCNFFQIWGNVDTHLFQREYIFFQIPSGRGVCGAVRCGFGSFLALHFAVWFN